MGLIKMEAKKGFPVLMIELVDGTSVFALELFMDGESMTAYTLDSGMESIPMEMIGAIYPILRRWSNEQESNTQTTGEAP